MEKRIISSPSELKQYADDETGAFTRYKRTYINRYNELLADPLFFKEMAKETNKDEDEMKKKVYKKEINLENLYTRKHV